MSATLHSVLVVVLIILGSALLFFSIFGTEVLKLQNSAKIDQLRSRFISLWLTAGVLLLVGAFSMIVFSGNKYRNAWTKEEKEVMVKKIMESSIFIHGTNPDTARLVSDCFIEKYTSLYTPSQMKEQNKLSTEELAKITNSLMIECLKKYGLPKIDTAGLDEHTNGKAIQMHL
jgi:hypothetical protein